MVVVSLRPTMMKEVVVADILKVEVVVDTREVANRGCVGDIDEVISIELPRADCGVGGNNNNTQQ